MIAWFELRILRIYAPTLQHLYIQDVWNLILDSSFTDFFICNINLKLNDKIFVIWRY